MEFENRILVGVTGLIGSGKDTVADFLCNQYNFKKISFAESLKDAISTIFSWDRDLLDGSTSESRRWREEVDLWWANRLNIPNLTPRWVLQQWGTELARNGFHNEIWIAAVENKIKNIKENVIITDCRFFNELTAIKNAGGIIVRTHRGPEPAWIDAAVAYNTTQDGNVQFSSKHILDAYKVHASEYSSIGYEYDIHLDNNNSLEDLYMQIEKQILKVGD